MSDDQDEAYRREMAGVARSLDELFNGKFDGPDRATAFVLLVFPAGEPDRCNYISAKTDRAEAIAAMQDPSSSMQRGASLQSKTPSIGEQVDARAKRLLYRPLSDAEAGRPAPEIAHEEDPDMPGFDRATAHMMRHGRVQLWPPAETERQRLRNQFLQLSHHIMALGRDDWPAADLIDQLGVDKPRICRMWKNHLRNAHALLSTYLGVLDEIDHARLSDRGAAPRCRQTGDLVN
jgi:hypothetical protein